jgi:hypothetical protein
MEKHAGGDVFLFQADDGKTRLEVHLEKETVWLTQAQLAALFVLKIPGIKKISFSAVSWRKWQLFPFWKQLATLMGLQAGLPLLDFSEMAGLRKEEYFAAVRAGMDLDFQPMTRLFVDIIELSS